MIARSVPHRVLTDRRCLRVRLDGTPCSTTGARHGGLTHDREDKSNTYHSDVEQIPDICRVEDRSGITPLTQLVIEESREPDVKEDLGHTYLIRIPFHEHRIVQKEKGNKKDNFEALEVPGDSKTREGIGRCLVIKTGLLLRINSEF